MKLEDLYCIDKAGKIRVFTCETNNNQIITATGLLGKKLTSKITNIKVGKQGRTILQQTEFEAKSLYNNKYNEGYKSHVDLILRKRSLDMISEDECINEIKYYFSDLESISELYKELNINYNSNKDWYPLPSLAEKWKDYKNKIKYPIFVQPKLNGVRCLAFLNREGKVTLMSREGQYYKVPHISDALHSFLISNPTIVLDGEIYKHGVPLQTISGAVRTEEESQLFSSGKQDFLEYWIYDLAINESQNVREIKRRELGLKHNFSSCIRFLESETVFTEEVVNELHDKWLEQGYEGAIVRDMSSAYMFSFRDKCLLKVKQFEDAEFIIDGCQMSLVQGPESFVFILKNDINDLTFKARPTGSLEMKQYWYDHIEDYNGKKATIRFKDRTNDGLPFHANLRHKDTQCLIEAIRDYE